MAWLKEFLGPTPKKVKAVIEQDEKDGYAKGTVYRAKEKLRVHEFEDGERCNKWWRLTKPDVPK
jgi:hypothetical protein